ncbi:MAG: aminotransferase class I/II-fold pyridoxal phosphate-dependent enzyme [Steroidobacteraceae bacterium]|nr:aminotransferase class I/II-fold pyridoxal phosphate-dependent enzyme [Steroidobacteraceae bacterium]
MSPASIRGDISPFHGVGINRLANARARRGLPVIHMEVGQPTARAPAAALAAARRALEGDTLGYWESEALKERIAAHYVEWYGVEIDPQRVVLTAGASGALVLAFMLLCRPGDRVALARPGYPAYRNTLRALHIEPLELPCGPETRYQPTAAMIEALDPAPTALIVASPANPTGTMLDRAELESLAAVCRERGIRLISDEIYHGITYGQRAVSALETGDEAFVIESFSKYWCMPGWRLGWAVVPPSFVEPMNRVSGNVYLSVSSPAQHAALAAMDAREELAANLPVYAANRQLLIDALPRLGITRWAPADGAFYLYCDVGHLTQDSLGFCHRLLADTGVALNTGFDFDAVEGGRWVRLSFAVSTDETRRAVELISGWLAEGGHERG